jgi:hypothetical protein
LKNFLTVGSAHHAALTKICLKRLNGIALSKGGLLEMCKEAFREDQQNGLAFFNHFMFRFWLPL